jgi:redox-sensing transcriptional repressor
MIANKNCIIRLSRYKNALYKFREKGLHRVFSNTLAEAVGVLPTQVRKDFSFFGISGNKRAGYQIGELLEKLNSILGKDEIQKVVIAGCGNIGSALMKYAGFEKEGIKIIAVFDINPAKCKRRGPIPVLPITRLKDFVSEHRIKIGVIAVPDTAAQGVFDAMVSAGIKGVLNFAPLRLKPQESVVINNVNLELELESVAYFINAQLKPKASQSG